MTTPVTSQQIDAALGTRLHDRVMDDIREALSEYRDEHPRANSLEVIDGLLAGVEEWQSPAGSDRDLYLALVRYELTGEPVTADDVHAPRASSGGSTAPADLYSHLRDPPVNPADYPPFGANRREG